MPNAWRAFASSSVVWEDRVSEVGEAELAMRLADIVEVKAGTMTLEMAQKRARKRRRESGLTPTQFHRELAKATGRSRALASDHQG